jgi:hypothetical protein
VYGWPGPHCLVARIGCVSRGCDAPPVPGNYGYRGCYHGGYPFAPGSNGDWLQITGTDGVGLRKLSTLGLRCDQTNDDAARDAARLPGLDPATPAEDEPERLGVEGQCRSTWCGFDVQLGTVKVHHDKDGELRPGEDGFATWKYTGCGGAKKDGSYEGTKNYATADGGCPYHHGHLVQHRCGRVAPYGGACRCLCTKPNAPPVSVRLLGLHTSSSSETTVSTP